MAFGERIRSHDVEAAVAGGGGLSTIVEGEAANAGRAVIGRGPLDYLRYV